MLALKPKFIRKLHRAVSDEESVSEKCNLILHVMKIE